MSLEYNLNTKTYQAALPNKIITKNLFAKLINAYAKVYGNDYILKIKENNG